MQQLFFYFEVLMHLIGFGRPRCTSVYAKTICFTLRLTDFGRPRFASVPIRSEQQVLYPLRIICTFE